MFILLSIYLFSFNCMHFNEGVKSLKDKGRVQDHHFLEGKTELMGGGCSDFFYSPRHFTQKRKLSYVHKHILYCLKDNTHSRTTLVALQFSLLEELCVGPVGAGSRGSSCVRPWGACHPDIQFSLLFTYYAGLQDGIADSSREQNSKPFNETPPNSMPTKAVVEPVRRPHQAAGCLARGAAPAAG